MVIMSESFWEVLTTTVAIILLTYVLTLADGTGRSIQIQAEKADGLEKVRQTTLVDKSTSNGVVVKGGDIVGAVRYYKGTPNISLEVQGWGSVVRYGTSPGDLNREFYPTDFPALSSEVEFLQSQFRVVSSTNGLVVYQKI